MKIGLIADAHGNLPAFEKALNILKKYGVSKIFFLGDAVGYIPHLGVLRLLRKNNIIAVKGNHEDNLIKENFVNEEMYQFKRCREQLNDDDKNWLTSLPLKFKLETKGIRLEFSHGSPDAPLTGYLYPDSELQQYKPSKPTIYFNGHTHWPMRRKNEFGAFFCNPGSCGLPRDYGGLGSLGIFDTSNHQFQILRFEISRITLDWLKCCAPINEGVVELIKRKKADSFLGEIADE